jgi:hypothetical protein
MRGQERAAVELGRHAAARHDCLVVCDEGDADPGRFWAGLVEAVRVGSGFGADAAGLLAVDGVMSADVTCSGVALAMLANLEEWGGYCGRVAEALVARYGLAERAVGFFRFFAEPAPGLAEQARSVVAAGLAAGEDPQEAVRAARAQISGR